MEDTAARKPDGGTAAQEAGSGTAAGEPAREADAIQVTLTANAGLLIRWRGTVLLLDALFSGDGHPFSAPTPADVRAMLDGTPPFEQVDFLLCTHAHPDHFSADLTREFLTRRTVKGVLLPEDESIRDNGLEAVIQARRVPCQMLSPHMRRGVFHPADGLTVEALRTRHLGDAYRDALHFCYRISFGGKRVLFTADADYTQETFADAAAEPLRALFVNPLFFAALRRPRFFHGTLPAERVCVYHIPFPEDDAMGMRGTTAHEALHWPGNRFPDLLCQRFQTVEL